WEAIKAQESRGQDGKARPTSILSGASPAAPALVEAYKLSSLAANVGFDWPEVAGIFEKLEEEIGEVKAHLGGVGNLRPAGRGTAGRTIALWKKWRRCGNSPRARATKRRRDDGRGHRNPQLLHQCRAGGLRCAAKNRVEFFRP